MTELSRSVRQATRIYPVPKLKQVKLFNDTPAKTRFVAQVSFGHNANAGHRSALKLAKPYPDEQIRIVA